MRFSDRVVAVGGTVEAIENGWQMMTIPNPINHKEDFTIRWKDDENTNQSNPDHPIHQFIPYLNAIETYLKIKGYSPPQSKITAKSLYKCKHVFCRKYLDPDPNTLKPVKGKPYCGDFCRTRSAMLRKTKKSAAKKTTTK